ncbi:hypothetical protein LCY76_06300 [Fictibacillus sp. KIGAM418]|uniref:Uncharacterized protein n=1 Tax=Fictibacillus marinisediminis TaxID=2878389 RepID=A0A9X2BC87_9BACL|nr:MULTISPECIES: hypothetical protein [Fictibacillus]MCK6256211.1 hypothetical protein [Fictibacillus marinisediminis]MED2974470.1 hypothetical protein [Fictibacillus sp. B-59209]
MKVLIGSILIVLVLCFGVWLILSPSFKKVGDKATKFKEKLQEEQDGEEKQKGE